MNRLNKVIDFLYKNIIFIFSSFILILIGIMNLVMSSYLVNWERTVYVGDNIWFNILFLIAFVSLALLIYKSRTFSSIDKFFENDRNFKVAKIILFSVIFALAALWALSTQFIPGVDEGELQEYAQRFLKGDYAMMELGGYVARYPNNRGLFIFDILLANIFGSKNYIIFELINSFAIAMTYKQCSQIAAKFGVGRVGQLCVYIFGVLFFPLIGYSIMVYGNVIGIALGMTSVKYELNFFDEHRMKDGILCALFITLAILIKFTICIYLVAIAIVAVYKLIRERKLENMLLICFLIIGYMIQSFVPTFILENVSGQKMDQPCSSMSFIAMGLQDSSDMEGYLAPGWWNSYIQTSYNESGCNTEKQSAMALESINDRISTFKDNPDYAVEFFTKKVASTWANPTFQCFGTVRNGSNIEPPNWVNWLLSQQGQDVSSRYFNFLELLIIFGAVLSLILNYNTSKYNDSLILPMILVGGFAFQLFWETKARYALLYFVVLIPYAVIGYALLISKLSALNGTTVQFKKVKFNFSGLKSKIIPCAVCFISLLSVIVLYSDKNGKFLTQDTSGYQQILISEINKYPVKSGEYSICGNGRALLYNESTCYLGSEQIIPLKVIQDRSELRLLFETTSVRRYLTCVTADDGEHSLVVSRSTNNSSQIWRAVKQDNGLISFLSSDNYALTFDYFDNNVILRPYTGSLNQCWSVIDYGTDISQSYDYNVSSSSDISGCDDICQYLSALKSMTNYHAFFSVKDIQGYSLNDEIINKLSELGFTNAPDLKEHEYHSFIGIVSDGKAVYQQIGGDEHITYKTTMNGIKADIESATLNSGNVSLISVNDVNYSVNYRGINIVVVDEEGKLVDSVAFDTHVQEFTCIR